MKISDDLRSLQLHEIHLRHVFPLFGMKTFQADPPHILAALSVRMLEHIYSADSRFHKDLVVKPYLRCGEHIKEALSDPQNAAVAMILPPITPRTHNSAEYDTRPINNSKKYLRYSGIDDDSTPSPRLFRQHACSRSQFATKPGVGVCTTLSPDHVCSHLMLTRILSDWMSDFGRGKHVGI